MKTLLLFVALACLVGCSSVESVQSSSLIANPGPTAQPLTINQLNQGVRPRVAGGSAGYANRDDGAPIVVIAPAPGQISAGGPGSASVDAWKGSHCKPGSPEASQYPCVTSDKSGNACQLGSCLPAEIKGLPSLAEINRQ